MQPKVGLKFPVLLPNYFIKLTVPVFATTTSVPMFALKSLFLHKLTDKGWGFMIANFKTIYAGECVIESGYEVDSTQFSYESHRHVVRNV
jgi:hypothetical protein